MTCLREQVCVDPRTSGRSVYAALCQALLTAADINRERKCADTIGTVLVSRELAIFNAYI